MCFLLRRYVRSGSEVNHSTAAHSLLSFSSFSEPSWIIKKKEGFRYVLCLPAG